MADENSANRSRGTSFLRDHLGWILSLLFLGLAAKCLMISQLSNALPYNDQWDGEAVDIYMPWFEHSLSIADFFRVHNEHRIFFTRIYDFALFCLNGQWDSQLQMLLNAVIHCLALAGFGWLMARLMGVVFWPVAWLPLALALVLPFSWENVVWGFQSQFYFLIIFSLLTIWLLGLNPPGSKRWWCGVLAAVCSLFTIASGCLASAAVALLEILKLLKQPAHWRRRLPTLGVCAAVFVAGLLLQGHVPAHAALKAHTPLAFLSSLGANLAWPSIQKPWLAPLNLLPLALLGWVYFRSRENFLPAEEMILGVGFWVLLQGASVAYARGVTGGLPVWRYMDSAGFIITADCLAIALLLARYRAQLGFRFLCYGAFAAWFACSIVSLVSLNRHAVKDIFPWWKSYESARLDSARAFMATDNEDAFKTQDLFSIPYPYAPRLVYLFRLPYIRTNLPACIRTPLTVIPQTNGDGSFILNGSQIPDPSPHVDNCWGSFTAQGPKARGSFESLPIRSSLPYVEIPVAGEPGQPGLKLALLNLATGESTDVVPPEGSGPQWRYAFVKAPPGEFKITARDDSDTGWLAFKGPRELGRLSFWTVRLLGAWKWFLAIGCALFVWSLGALLWARCLKSKICWRASHSQVS